MSRGNKPKNLLYSLRDRELNSSIEPYRLSLNILSQLIQSKQSVYNYNYSETSSKRITYDFGLLYFDNYSSTSTIYGHACKPSKSHSFKPKNAMKKVIDVITYCAPVNQTFDDCKCKYSLCSCASGFILCLTEDCWLCQYNLNTGALMKEIYVSCINSDFKFRYCDWDEYAKRVILTSGLNHEREALKTDIVVNLAVFSVFPLEFIASFEIKKSVFGKNCKHANVDDQLLILGMGYDQVHIYSLLDVLAQGNLCPYKIGENYRDLGKVGIYPTGLPLNFNIETAPPLLFDVECFGQNASFGGYPYHCIFPKPNNQLSFVIQNLKDNDSKNCVVESNVWNDEPNVVTFHPDNSNRIVLRELLRVCVLDLKYVNGEIELKESYCMDFHGPDEKKIVPQFNIFGRRVNKRCNVAWSLLCDRSIMATAFEDELNLFGILGVRLKDPTQTGFIKLYDNATGKEVKCITLNQSLCDTNYYQLDIDREMLIIMEKDSKNLFRVFAYQLTTI